MSCKEGEHQFKQLENKWSSMAILYCEKCGETKKVQLV
jgi:hypothetical protein